ncbi:SAM-dependent methyltransferase [Saccharothrix isguenensis]
MGAERDSGGPEDGQHDLDDPDPERPAVVAGFDRPGPARIHDWLLGGTLNTPLDRAQGVELLRRLPHLRETARRDRAFLRRCVRRMLADGVRQFLDLGSGLPTKGAVHQVADDLGVEATVVYVDHDPAVVALTNLLLADTPSACGIEADLRSPDLVLAHPDTSGLILQPQFVIMFC